MDSHHFFFSLRGLPSCLTVIVGFDIGDLVSGKTENAHQRNLTFSHPQSHVDVRCLIFLSWCTSVGTRAFI